MLPPALDTFLDAAYDDLSISIERVALLPELIEFSLLVKCRNESQAWRISSSPLEYNLVSGHKDDIQLLESDPRLWDYTDLQSSLYFNGRSEDPTKLALELMRVHFELLGPKVSLGKYMRVGTWDVLQLCDEGFGLFAEGPLMVLEAYAQCLLRNGVGASLVGTRKARTWGAEGWQELDTKPSLLCLGESWVVATGFRWERIK